MKTYYFFTCCYCQEPIRISEDHETIKRAGLSDVHAHVECKNNYKAPVIKPYVRTTLELDLERAIKEQRADEYLTH